MRHNGADKQQTGTTHLQARSQKWCMEAVRRELVALFDYSPYELFKDMLSKYLLKPHTI